MSSSISSSSSIKSIKFACGHIEQTNNTGKKIWRLLRRWTPNPLSRSSQQTVPAKCESCSGDHHREVKMHHFLDRCNTERQTRRTTANPLSTRCAPPAKGANATLMAIALGEDETSVKALKDIQQSSRRAAVIQTPTRAQQEADQLRMTADIARVDELWREVHESHRGLIGFPLQRPYSKYAGPYQCRLCREYRNALADPHYRQQTVLKDHYIPPDCFSSEFPAELDADPTDFGFEQLSATAEFFQSRRNREQSASEAASIKSPKSEDSTESEDDNTFRVCSGVEKEEERHPAQLWTPQAETPRAPSSPHLWQPTARSEPANRELAIQDHETFLARERIACRNRESLVHEADLSAPIPPHVQLWRRSPPPSSPLLNPTHVDGALAFGTIRNFLSLPPTTTPADIVVLPMFDASHEDEIFSSFVTLPSRTPVPPHIRAIEPQGKKPRVRDALSIRSSNEDFRAREEFREAAMRVEWPEPSSPRWPDALNPDVGRGGVWEADESVWDDIDDAPNATLCIVPKHLTRREALCYGRSAWRRHRVPREKLSPLRNESVLGEEEEEE